MDGRDAILQADQVLTGGENECTIWEAFAARVLGFSASQGNTNSRTDGTEAFDLPPSCEGPPVASCNVSTSQSSYVTGETLELMDLQYANDSGAPLPARLRLQLSFGAAFTAELFDSGALVLPGDFDVQLGPISLFPIPADLPRGDWEFRCVLDNPTTESVMAENLAPFEIQ